jgi:hypothetical protein
MSSKEKEWQKKKKETRLTRVQLHYEAHDPIIQQLESPV